MNKLSVFLWHLFGITIAISWDTRAEACDPGTYRIQCAKNCPDNGHGVGYGICPQGTYSTAENCNKALEGGACTLCQEGRTTSGTLSSSCDAECPNSANVKTWKRVTRTSNKIEHLCEIDTCIDGYEKSGAFPYVCTKIDNPDAVPGYWGIYSEGKDYGKTHILCPKGQYVYSCGKYIIGYNWLTSVTLTDLKGVKHTIDNYNVGNNTLEKMNQMRGFFGNQMINYERGCVTDSDSGTYSCEQKGNKDASEDRDLILGLACNPFISGEDVKCAVCPDGGTVEKSSVQIDNYNPSSLLLIRNSWNFHTIADCYVSEFEDNSGSFIYVPEASDLSTKQGTQCYYSKSTASVAGDYISDLFVTPDSKSGKN